MLSFINSPLRIGSLLLPNRLIQGPLAGFSCAPFRALFSAFTPPAYCVSEMISAHDIIHKHLPNHRYLYRAPNEGKLCYQLSGTKPDNMAAAAQQLEQLGADLIDINCGCPKAKIRKKGAGSALLEQPEQLITIIRAVKAAIKCPLTVKIRLSVNHTDTLLARQIADAGADALIVHGRRWVDDYDTPCDWQRIGHIKQAIDVPVIVNGDISDALSLSKAIEETRCDGFMISRASTGKPWLYQELLQNQELSIDHSQKMALFMTHLQGLKALESEHQAVLQSKSLVRYYFRHQLTSDDLTHFYSLTDLEGISEYLSAIKKCI